MATSEATPTATPSVVSEFRSAASRKLRTANSVRSRPFIPSLPLVHCGKFKNNSSAAEAVMLKLALCRT